VLEVYIYIYLYIYIYIYIYICVYSERERDGEESGVVRCHCLKYVYIYTAREREVARRVVWCVVSAWKRESARGAHAQNQQDGNPRKLLALPALYIPLRVEKAARHSKERKSGAALGWATRMRVVGVFGV